MKCGRFDDPNKCCFCDLADEFGEYYCGISGECLCSKIENPEVKEWHEKLTQDEHMTDAEAADYIIHSLKLPLFIEISQLERECPINDQRIEALCKQLEITVEQYKSLF